MELLLKGGGCENVGAQYSLPDNRLGAGRDLAGVRKCVLDAVYQAQGKGCSPGVLGVCVGGDRVTGFEAEAGTTVLKADAGTRHHYSGTESHVVGLDERHHHAAGVGAGA